MMADPRPISPEEADLLIRASWPAHAASDFDDEPPLPPPTRFEAAVVIAVYALSAIVAAGTIAMVLFYR